MKIYNQAKFANNANQLCPKLPGEGGATARPLSNCQTCSYASHMNCHAMQAQSGLEGAAKKA